MLKSVRNFLRKTRAKINTKDPLMIHSYSGYASKDRLYTQGRVLENENIFLEEDQNRIRTLIHNFKRFETDEIRGAKVRLTIRGKQYEVITDEEGYYQLDEAWDTPLSPDENRWIDVKAELIDNMGSAGALPVVAEDKILFPAIDADLGVISDVDDTVLRTFATSRYRLKMLYATLFLDPYERLPLENVGEIFSALEKGGNGKRENPIFYVSNSPWNIYDSIAAFLDFNKFPKGPILLRDIGWQMLRKTIFDETHKMRSIRHIMNTYPDLPFVMLGDTAAKDADFYLTLADEFPGRVKAIYIRNNRDNANGRRIAKLVEAKSDINIVLVRSSAEILDHARSTGLLP